MKSRKEVDTYRSYLVKIYGVVQGVGFRPFVYRKAVEFNIRGWALNAGGAVIIDCAGTEENIKHFLLEVVNNPPPLARVEKVQCTVKECGTSEGFTIRESLESTSQISLISPDVAVCPKCLEDIRNREGSRHRYAFTNCTECGPRYSIIKALPYDRKHTTMQAFQMCKACDEEYHSPLSRRFHAQPNCCEECGPGLFLTDNKGLRIQCEDVVSKAIELLKQGKLLAIKGIGGFHLACDARNEAAINMLRERKHRKHKPLALMVRDMEVAKEICCVSEKEEELLRSNKRPIVLLQKREDSVLPEGLAPRQNRLGVMLPYTPLHYLLLEEDLKLLVMTSANISGMPIEYKNEEAVRHLGRVADYFLMNNRDIYIPVDDSVVKTVRGEESVVRRARGYSPYSLKTHTERQIIALGAEQKNTICVSKNGYVHMGQYLGDLEQLKCYQNFLYVLKHLTGLFNVEAEAIVHDMHPGYFNTQYAKQQNTRLIEVQHHHAHMVSCMAEYSLYEPVIGVIFDGTGYGLDGAVWGGEFFVGTRSCFKRVGHLQYVKIQGGELAVREPWRCASSYLEAMGYDSAEMIKGVEEERVKGVKQALKAGFNCFTSSSMGRLFDAAAALIGVRNTITYDGQAAIELENIIEEGVEEQYQFDISNQGDVFGLEYKGIIKGILEDIQGEVAVCRIAAKFHNTIANAACEVVYNLREQHGLKKVVLSGGVFENQYLLNKMLLSLKEKGFEVFYNKQIPINDGGISFGQLHAASAIMGEKDVSCSTS